MNFPDVSLDFKYSKLDADIIQRVTKHGESPRAIRAFNNEHRQLSDYGYWYLLGTLWVSYADQTDLELWRRLFRSPRPNRNTSLMKPSELAEWNYLPDEFFVYRGHNHGETDCIAFSIDKFAAARFAIQRDVKEVWQYLVKKEDVLCLFLRRGESEVILLDNHKKVGTRPILIVVSTEKSGSKTPDCST